MRVLLDTELALWWQIAPERLPDAARELVMSAATSVFLSDSTLWELAERCSQRRLRLDLPLFHSQCMEDGFQWLPITAQHILQVATMPFPTGHRDPLERLRVAQSQLEPLLLVTTNPLLSAYGSTVRLVSGSAAESAFVPRPATHTAASRRGAR